MQSQHVFSTSTTVSTSSLFASTLSPYELTRLCDPTSGIPHAGIAPFDPNRKSHARKQPDGHVKRPRNAWIRFRSDYVYLQKRLGLTENRNQTEITTEASTMWSHLTPQQKAPWEALAQADKEEHKTKHPNYEFKPSRIPSPSVAAAAASYSGRSMTMKVEDDDDEAYSPPSRSSRRSRKVHSRASSRVSESSYGSNPSAAPSPSTTSSQYSPVDSASPFSTCSSSPSSTSSLELTTTWPNQPQYFTFDSSVDQSWDMLPLPHINNSFFSGGDSEYLIQPSTGPEWHETGCLIDPTIPMNQHSTWSLAAPDHISQPVDLASTYDPSFAQQPWYPHQTPTSSSFPPSLHINTTNISSPGYGYTPSPQRTRPHRSDTITPAMVTSSSYPPTAAHLMHPSSSVVTGAGAGPEDSVWEWLHKPVEMHAHAVYTSASAATGSVSSASMSMDMHAHMSVSAAMPMPMLRTSSSSSSLYGALGESTAGGNAK